jgi:hypothetical protein
MKKIFLYITGVVILFSECRQPKPLDITLPESEKRLVISSVVVPGATIGISVSYSFSALSSRKDSTGNLIFDSATYKEFLAGHALVKILYKGHADTLIKTVPGIYISTNTLQVDNENYVLDVFDSTTLLHITAQSVMLPKIGFDTLYFTKEKTASDTSVSVHFKISDKNRNADDYYMVSYYNAEALPFYSQIFNDPNPKKFHEVEIYNDKNVNQDHEIIIDKPLHLPNQNDFIIVEMAHISREYYDFLSAYKNDYALVYQLLGEPVTLPTNIMGGYGFFSTINPVFRVVDLSKL